jgi:hypothetical protein
MSALAVALSFADDFAPAMPRQRHAVDKTSCDFRNMLHLVPPSSVPSTWTGAKEVSQATNDRKNQERAPIEKLDEDSFTELFQAALENDYGNLKSKHKEIARHAGAASHKTAEAWTQGISLPGFYRGLKLAAKSPSLAKEVVRLIAMESQIDPEFQRDLVAFMQQRMGK